MLATVMRRSLLALAVLGATLGAPIAVPDAGAWTEGVCTDPTGVTVIIDFQDLGADRPFVRCASQPVTSGFSALLQAEIDYTTTVRFPGFICRIGGKPETDPCQTASPATAYWSYWIAARGGQWCYSNWGAGNRTPPPGSVEGWSFSLNRSASTSPPPRGGVPAALPGTAPGALPGNDCDPSAAAPKPSPGDPTPTTPPAPPVTVPPAQGAAPGVGGTGAPAQGGAPTVGNPASEGVPNYEQQRDTPAGTAVDPATTSTILAPTDTPVAEVEAATTGSDDESVAVDERSEDAAAFADEATASIDLSGGSRNSGTPIGVIVAVVLVAALGGGSYFLRRRRGTTDPA